MALAAERVRDQAGIMTSTDEDHLGRVFKLETL
jgi:hypothetical protein